MAGGYGSEKNGVSLGVFWDGIEYNAAGSQGRIYGAEIRIHRDVNISDSTNSLSWSGGAVTDGSSSNLNVSGSGNKTIKSVTGQWQDLVYGSTKTASFAASMSGVDYAGGTISESRTVTYKAREYLAPVAPTNLEWTQTALGNFTLSWTNHHSTAAPWTTVTLLRTEVGGPTTEVSVPSPTTATSIAQNGLALDKRYTWQLRITNVKSTVTSAATTETPIPLHTMTMTYASRAIGEAVTFTIEKYGSANTSSIYFMKNDVKTVVWTKQAGTSFAYTFSQADWAGFLPNETSKPFIVGIETFSGDTSLGVLTYTITVTVPNAAPYLPTVTAPTRIEQVSSVQTAFGVNVFVKTRSRIRYAWSGAAGASASVTKREIWITRSWLAGTSKIDVTNVSGWLYDEVPTGSGTVTAQSVTTDSRGRITPTDQGIATFTVYNYADPVITSFSVTRCLADGNSNNSGTHVKFTLNVSATSVNLGSDERNQMQYRIKLLDSSGNETGSDLITKALNTTLTSGGTITTVAVPGLPLPAGSYSTQTGYSFRLTLNDDLTNVVGNSIARSASISSEIFPLTIGDKGIAIGKVYNDSSKALDIVGNSLFTGNVEVTGAITSPYLNTTFLAKAPEVIPGSANLNNYTTPGFYTQSANAHAASGTNYPVALAGLLEVSYVSGFVYQRYTSYGFSGTSPRMFTRGYYNSTWSAWIETSIVGHTHDDRYYTEAEVNALINALKSDAKTSGTSGSWSWWYRTVVDLVEIHIEYSGALASDAAVVLEPAIHGVPANKRATENIPLAATSIQATRTVSARITAAGQFAIRNMHTASVTGIVAHGIYSVT